MNLKELRQKYPEYKDITDEQLAISLHKKYYSDIPLGEFAVKIGVGKMDPTEGMSGGERFLASAGKAMTDVGRGIGQTLGLVSQEDLREVAERDAPLSQPMQGAGGLIANPGKAGAVVGGIAPFLPLSAIPGANTVAGSAAIGAAIGAAQPIPEGSVAKGKTINAAIGGVLGAGTQAVSQKLAQSATKQIAGLANQKMQNVTRDATLKAGQEAGYVVPPVQANPSMTNRALEGLSGKITTAQGAAIKNQQVTNNLAKRSIGIADDAPITKEALKQIRDEAGEVYQLIQSNKYKVDKVFQKDISRLADTQRVLSEQVPELADSKVLGIVESLKKKQLDGRTVIALTKQLRTEATKAFRAGDTDVGRFYRGASDAVEDLVERNLKDPSILEAFRSARVTIAKAHTVEAALNESTGNVVAGNLSKQLAKGKPLSGELELIATFGRAFPKAVQEVTSSMPGISPLDFGTAGLASAATQNPYLMGAAVLRPVTRAGILSAPYQKAMTTPGYKPGVGNYLKRILSKEPSNMLLRTAIPAAAVSE
jgi:hypothetical protein